MATTVKSLSDLGAAMQRVDMPSLAAKLYEFLVRYQIANSVTPAYNVMANELQMPEETVKRLLGMLENQGRVHFISRNPPAIMFERIEDDMRDGTLKPRPGAYDRYLSAEGMRHRLARMIHSHECETGSPPSLATLSRKFGMDLLYVDQMINILVRLKLVERTRDGPRLTDAARQFYGFKKESEMPATPNEPELPVAMPSADKTSRIIVIAKAQSQFGRRASRREFARTRVDEFCRALAMAKQRYTVLPRNSWFAVQLGLSPKSGSEIGYAAKMAMEAGYIVSSKRTRSTDYQFTQLGKEKFMGESSVLNEGEKTMETEKRARAKERQPRRSPYARVDEFCKIVADYVREYGSPPILAYVADRLGFQGGGSGSRILQAAIHAGYFEEKGDHKLGTSMRFTEKGRKRYLDVLDEPIGEPGESAPQPVIKQPPRKAAFHIERSPHKRIDQFCKIVAEHMREHGYAPLQIEIGERMGYSGGSQVTRIVQMATEAGYIEPKPPGSTGTSLKFTEKGRKRYLDVTPEPAPQPVEEKRVAYDVAAFAPLETGIAEPESGPKTAHAIVGRMPSQESVRAKWPADLLHEYDDGALIVELINRGYIVKKG